MISKKVKIGISFALIALLLVWLTISGFEENMQYYVSISEVKAMTNTASNKGLRVKGFLVPGSLKKTEKNLQVSFLISENDEQLLVHYDKELPDTFKDGSEVLVEGKYTPEGYFDAEVLMAKCPSKYESEGYGAEDAAPGYSRPEYSGQEGTN
jgi:cytochrome c-type biogenesis protein CcmE